MQKKFLENHACLPTDLLALPVPPCVKAARIRRRRLLLQQTVSLLLLLLLLLLELVVYQLVLPLEAEGGRRGQGLKFDGSH